MDDRSGPVSELDELRQQRAALTREVERLRQALAESGRAAARREEARTAENLGHVGRLAASEGRSAAAEVDARAAWSRAAELGAALGHRIAEGQARLIASQAAVASLQRANERLSAGQAEIALREADLRAVIESAIDCAIVTTDRDGLVLAWNSGACRLLGWEEPGALTMDLAAVLPPEEPGALADDIAAALSGARVSREGWLCRQDGSRVWAGIEAMALRADGREEPAGVLWMLRDRSAAHEADAALREREERLRGVLDGMTEGFGLLAPDFTILEHNLEALRMGGRPREEIVGRSHWDAYPGTRGSELGRVLEHAMAARVPVSLEHRYAFEDGRARWLDMRAYPTPDGALAVFWRDVTERKRAEDALRASEERYRALFTSIDSGFCVAELRLDAPDGRADYRIVEANPAFYLLTGFTEAILGRWLREAAPALEEHWYEAYARVARTGEPVRFEQGSGMLGRWFDVHAFRIGAPGQHRVAILFNDITIRRRAEDALRESEERQAFLLRFSDALRAAPDADAVATRAIRMLFDQMRLDRCYVGVYRLAEDRGEFLHQVSDGRLPPLPDSVRLSDFPEALRVASDRTLVIEDVAETEGLSDADRRNLDALGLRALVAATLREGEDRPVWAIVAAAARPRRWTAGEIALVEDVAERSWAAMERTRAEAALRESEERFRGFAENSADVLWIADGTGTRLQYLSPAYEAVFGTPREAALSDMGEFRAMVHPDDRAAFDAAMPRTLAGEAMRIAYRIVRPADGRIVHVLDAGFPVRGPDGAIRQVAGIVQDVTEQRRMQADLAERERNLRALVEGVPHLLWRAAAPGRWHWASPQWSAYTGLSEEASRGHGWLEAVHPDDRAAVMAAWHAAGEAGTFETDCRLRRAADGAWRWFRCRGIPLHVAPDAAGQPTEWLGTSTDVDDQVRAREELERGRQLLEARVAERTAELMAAEETLRQAQKLEAIGQLTGGIAHDFNNMLQGVAGSLDMARRRMEAGRQEEAARYLDAARDATGRAAGLTRRLLAFARRQRLDARPVDPTALVRGMAEMLRRTMGPGIGLDLDFQDGAGFVTCDPNELESALLNLCINARDAMPDGGRLVISARDRRLSAGELEGTPEAVPGPFVEIAVADTGSGMPPEVLERVLEPFFTTKPLGQGTGLGLSQVYGFARQSGGALRIESSPGRGTTVRLWLPFSARREDAAEGPGDAAAAEEGGGATVLLVDDERGVRDPAAARLRDLGYAVAEAADGPSALRLIEGGLWPDLLVTDVGLPGGMDGTRLAEAARRLLPGLPVLFMTGYATAPLPPDAEVIGKPFTLDALTSRVRGALAGG